MIQVLGFILVGAVIGVLARLFKRGRQRLSILATVALGCVGALIGGIVATLLGTGSLDEIDLLGFVVAVVAATLLVTTAESMTNR